MLTKTISVIVVNFKYCDIVISWQEVLLGFIRFFIFLDVG